LDPVQARANRLQAIIRALATFPGVVIDLAQPGEAEERWVIHWSDDDAYGHGSSWVIMRVLSAEEFGLAVHTDLDRTAWGGVHVWHHTAGPWDGPQMERLTIELLQPQHYQEAVALTQLHQERHQPR
jgi:hypothetical protein